MNCLAITSYSHTQNDALEMLNKLGHVMQITMLRHHGTVKCVLVGNSHLPCVLSPGPRGQAAARDRADGARALSCPLLQWI